MLDQATGEFPEYEKLKRNAQVLYSSAGRIFAPAFNQEVHFTMDGFNHLISRDGRKERPKADQMGRFKLLPQVLKLVAGATFYQGYEERRQNFSLKTKKGGRKIKSKPVRYWTLLGMVDGKKIKVIIKKIGDNGTLRFWTVYPDWHTEHHGDVYFRTTMEGDPELD